MRRVFATAALLAACAAAWLALPSPAPAQAPTSDRVVLVLAPYLTWSDVTPTSTPTIWSLAENGAVGAVNARSRGRESGDKGSPVEAALSISAGAWAVQDPQGAAAYSVGERYEVGTAAEAFRRSTGARVGENRIVFLGLPATARRNAERSYDIVLGTLGQAVLDAGGSSAAIGNSDVGYVTGEQRKVRPAALAAMDEKGLVPFGDVSTRLLTEAPYAPFGIETDLERFDRALERVEADGDRIDGPELIVLDPGDTYRATKFRSQVTDEISDEHRLRGLTALDTVVRMASDRFEGATIIVASTSTGDPEQGDAEGLGPIVVSGEGFDGYLTSSSTQRTGLVTNLDVSATVLKVLGVEQPVQMLGVAMDSNPSEQSLSLRLATLASLNDEAVAIDAAKPGVVNAFVGFTVLVLVLAAFVLVRSHAWSRRACLFWMRALKAGLLLVLGVPVSSWLMFVWMPNPTSASMAVAGLIATAFVVWISGLWVWWKTPMRVPVAVLSLGTVAVVVIDQWLGAPASFTNFFGYSPLLAARFYGMGNEAAAIIFGAAVVGIALLFDQWPASRGVAIAKRFGLPVLGVVVVFTSAAPFWGANIGVAIWGVVGFGLAWVLMNDHHVSWRLVFWLALAVVVVIAAFAAIDLLGGGQQTHLARALSSADQGGLGELWTIIVRKAETNARVLTRTNWAYILVATLAFLGFMRWRPQGDFAQTLTDNPNFADAITVSLVAGLVAYFTEDSGIVIPALEVFYVGVALSWLMLSRIASTGSSLSSTDEGDETREME
ncbi:MAG TPA: hypothetical protein VLA05_04955 [Coriobacteriia bacterium]|nr:hypothetical protein [Coriobacteriia bacterium]